MHDTADPARPLRFLLAPDKFKGTLNAAEVGASIARGIRDVLPQAETTVLPIADGGEGTLQVALASGFVLRHAVVPAPTGARTVEFAVCGDTAVLEMASICGLHTPDMAGTSVDLRTTGVLGLAIRAVLESGARCVIVGLGGSASTDGGVGMLAALGARFLDVAGREVAPTPRNLTEVVTLELTGLTPAIKKTKIVFAIDVDAPLLGPTGAAHAFGPQKGANASVAAALEEAMVHWAKLVTETVPGADPETPGSGAAGGTAFGGLALGGLLHSGADLCLRLAGFDQALVGADVVVTGEGKLDHQTLQGKAPLKIAKRARAFGRPTVAVVGAKASTLTEQVLTAHGFNHVYTLVGEAPAAAQNRELSRATLRTIGRRLARDMSHLDGNRPAFPNE